MTEKSSHKNEATNNSNHYKIEASIVVDRPVQDVFSFVTDLHNADKISEHLVNLNIIAGGQTGVGNKYSRQLMIHGFKNNQEVTVTGYEPNKRYKTSTRLFDVGVWHTYFFEATDNDKTRVRLIKEAFFEGTADHLLKPFVIHQLTRPEHDGQHLAMLKNAVETVKPI